MQCTSLCKLDMSSCTGCGNGIVEGTELCDGPDLAGANCEGPGFDSGTLICDSPCGLDLSQCGTCGDSQVAPGEVCDGSAVTGLVGCLFF